jgi:hypothetical protein
VTNAKVLRDRLCANIRHGGNKPIPMIAEVGPETATEWNPAFGAYANARGVAGFYRGLYDDVLGAERALDPATARTVVSGVGSEGADRGLGRRSSFGVGVAAPLTGQHFGAISPRSFGHGAEGGASFGWVDLDRDQVAAVVTNGLLDFEGGVAGRRVTMSNWIPDTAPTR